MDAGPIAAPPRDRHWPPASIRPLSIGTDPPESTPRTNAMAGPEDHRPHAADAGQPRRAVSIHRAPYSPRSQAAPVPPRPRRRPRCAPRLPRTGVLAKRKGRHWAQKITSWPGTDHQHPRTTLRGPTGLHRMFVDMDTSGDGSLDFEEFQVRHGYPRIPTPAAAANASDAADATARSSPASPPHPAMADPRPDSPQLTSTHL